MLEEMIKPLRESVKLLGEFFKAIRSSVGSSLGVIEDFGKSKERRAKQADKNRMFKQRETLRKLYGDLCPLFVSNVVFTQTLRNFDGRGWPNIAERIESTEDRISDAMTSLAAFLNKIPPGHHVTAAAVKQTLTARQQVLAQLKSMAPPFSQTDISAIHSLAAVYETLFGDLGQLLDTLAVYLRDKPVDVKKIKAVMPMMSEDIIRRLNSGKKERKAT
jgi:hypothetical protein